MDLATAAVDDFTPAVGETFTLKAADLELPLTLTQAQPYHADAPPRDPDGRRNPFSLAFRGPPDPVLAQAIYHLEHDRLGALEIFIVATGRDAEGTDYHVVFN